MPFEIIWEPQGVIQRHWGVLHPQELDEFNSQFYGDSRSDNCKFMLTDFLEVTDHTFDQIDISVAAGYDIGASKSIKNFKIAFVVREPKVREGCELYRKILASCNTTWEVRLFEDMGEARRWCEEPKLALSGCSARA
ncbi:hypothetical protein [Cerasicoccus arenae]|nr:hypothetical protein [Cerasicoccus arenae]MBK1859159.1 hypothetical protein [Cerasicoccus arenae]